MVAWVAGTSGASPPPPRQALRGGIAKVKFQEIALTFGDKCPPNGANNAPMAPRPHLGCPHEGSRVATEMERSTGVQIHPKLRVQGLLEFRDTHRP